MRVDTARRALCVRARASCFSLEPLHFPSVSCLKLKLFGRWVRHAEKGLARWHACYLLRVVTVPSWVRTEAEGCWVAC